jgi:hypothetical protein
VLTRLNPRGKPLHLEYKRNLMEERSRAGARRRREHALSDRLERLAVVHRPLQVQPVRAKTKYNGFYAPAACYQAMTVIEEDLADDGPDGASTEEEDGGDVFEPAPLSHPKGSLLCVKLAGASASAWGFGVCVADALASDKKVLCVLANFDREDCLVSIPGDVKETFRDDAILIKKSRVLRTCRKDDEYSVLDKETMDIKVNEDLVVATDAMMTSMLRAARQRRRTNHQSTVELTRRSAHIDPLLAGVRLSNASLRGARAAARAVARDQ